jgi:DNA polymerase-3 subunit alpha
VGGIVTSKQLRQSKNGNPFVIFKLEDYNGTVEMSLFGEDFVRMGNYIEEGLFLHVKGKLQNRWNSDTFEFRPNFIQLLTEVRTKYSKELCVQWI